MAQVFQMIATDENDPYFDASIVNGDYHAKISYAGPRTVCGFQLDGDDGVAGGKPIKGFITCSGCLSIVREIKSMRNCEP